MNQLAALRLFLRVVERGSISGAGRSLGFSTTAASRHVQELETALKARLLHRTTRHVSPTEAGRLLAERVRPLLEQLDGALQQAGDLHSRPAGLLRVVARRSFGILHVAPAIASFREKYPLVDVELMLTEVMDLVPSHGVDVVIRLGSPAEKSFVATRLASERRVLCASPAYLARCPAPVVVGDLARHECLAYQRQYEPALWIVEGADGRHEVPVSGLLRSNSGEVLRRAALDGLGLALLPNWLVAADLTAGLLIACMPESRAYPAGYQAEIYAVHARQEVIPAKVAVFVAHLRTHIPGGCAG